MANEVTVIEQVGRRGVNSVMVTPFLNVQTLDLDELSDAFTDSTEIVSISTTTACSLEFSNQDQTDPDGAGAGSGVIPLAAGQYHDFAVRAGDKVFAKT